MLYPIALLGYRTTGKSFGNPVSHSLSRRYEDTNDTPG